LFPASLSRWLISWIVLEHNKIETCEQAVCREAIDDTHGSFRDGLVHKSGLTVRDRMDALYTPINPVSASERCTKSGVKHALQSS
jgi:hypothetical protein